MKSWSSNEPLFAFLGASGFFLQELQVACARSIMAEVDGRIVGYVLYWLLPGVVDIHNIAVHVGLSPVEVSAVCS